MSKLFIYILRKIFKMERTIYCITGCRVEFPMHRAYYKRRRMKYYEYLATKNPRRSRAIC